GSLPEKVTKSEALFHAIEQGESTVLVGSGSCYGSEPSIVMLNTPKDQESGDRPQIKKVDFGVWATLGEDKNKRIFYQEDFDLTHAFFLPQGSDIRIITAYGAMLRIDADDIA